MEGQDFLKVLPSLLSLLQTGGVGQKSGGVDKEDKEGGVTDEERERERERRR